MPGRPVVQAMPDWGNVSSVELSQSSSMLLQTSVLGAPGVQVCAAPPTQFCTVRAQAPTPHEVEPSASSMAPSQSSSMPLQISVLGAPGEHDCEAPPTQFCTVRVQAPTPHEVEPSASSVKPS